MCCGSYRVYQLLRNETAAFHGYCVSRPWLTGTAAAEYEVRHQNTTERTGYDDHVGARHVLRRFLLKHAFTNAKQSRYMHISRAMSFIVAGVATVVASISAMYLRQCYTALKHVRVAIHAAAMQDMKGQRY
ncbi:hypothetical protein C7974DRAFT_469721 [Boeremia exigua]|uniref:uncharacterized protein n=1 Tax=Boeremia exigua TaxID=749465 RepID=UPI001E8EA563|nr:uncharacterized protein C7974DRAFT_469721 [Boeremia exigua]KAH6639131.1 hypothetical protein C7974DRAFT_469721 [Boeremia exigua]